MKKRKLNARVIRTNHHGTNMILYTEAQLKVAYEKYLDSKINLDILYSKKSLLGGNLQRV